MMHRWLLRSFVAASCGGLALVVAACNARIVDVGTHDSGIAPGAVTVEDAGGQGSAYGCAEWIDEELYALREGACAGFCPTPGTPPTGAVRYPLASKKELIAASAGEWLFCRGSFGPADAVGVEFAPGCRLFFLRYDADGKLVRGTERAFQASYDIHHPRPAGTPARIDVHIDDERSITLDVEVNRCPEGIRLTHTYAASIELARPLNNPNNPGNPTR